jgi:hypothetical protein
MEFVQHIQLIILPEKLSQNKAEEKNKKKPRICKKCPAFIDSFVGVWAFRPIFF